MNKSELLKFLRTGHNDKTVPCGFWKHFGEGKEKGSRAVTAHLEYYRQTGVPIVKIMNEHFYRLDVNIEKPEDWRKIQSKEIRDTHYTGYLEEIAKIRKELGKDAFLLATIHVILVSACHATDGPGVFVNPDNTVTRHLKQDPESVKAGLEQIAKTLENLSLACLEAGADGIYYALLGGEEHRFTKEFYEKYVMPEETKLLANVMKQGIVFLHICKDHPRLVMFRDYPAHVVNWAVYDSSYSLKDGAGIFPGKVIMGGFDNRQGALIDGNQEKMLWQMKKAVEEVGRDRLIIGADCTLPGNLPEETIKTAVGLCESL